MSLIHSYCLNLSKVFCDPLQSLAELTLGNAILKLSLYSLYINLLHPNLVLERLS